MNDKEKATLAAGAAVLIVAGSAINYIRIMRVERAKRAKIDEWEFEVERCIANSYTRMAEYIESEDYSFEGLMRMFTEETRFLNIVKNQPMY